MTIEEFVSEASFQLPDYIEQSAWLEHAPFAFWLVNSLRPRTIVELGTHWGFSYFSFCQATAQTKKPAHCFAIDTWTGDEHAGFYGEDVYEKVESHNHQRFSSFSTLIRSTFHDASSHFDDESVDLLHIDGRHYYEDVRRDFETWRAKLSDASIVLFHDTNVHERDFGVFRLWGELSKDYPHFEFLHGHGLGVLGVGGNLPTSIQRLLSQDEQTGAVVRDIYARLGANVADCRKIFELRRSIEQVRAKHANELVALQERLDERIRHSSLLNGDLQNRNAQISSLQLQLARRRSELSLLSRNLVQRDAEKIQLRRSLVEATAELVSLRVQLQTQNVVSTVAPTASSKAAPIRSPTDRRPSSKLIKLQAYLRHPRDSESRKKFRAQRNPNNQLRQWVSNDENGNWANSNIGLKLRAAWRHPFNSEKRKKFRAVGNQIAAAIDVAAIPLLRTYLPRVSAIIPSFNHGKFLRQRIESILNQTCPPVEILIIDDCSTDDSREIIKEYAVQYPDTVRFIFNERNEGSVFAAWRKGIECVSGDLVWVCESDDYCEATFLERLVKYFANRSVTLAFGRIQFCDAEGKFQAGLDEYREGAEAGIWQDVIMRPANEWFCRGFGVNNLIANVGGCLFRRQTIPSEVWEQVLKYEVVGDWHLYCYLAGGGNIVFDPDAIAYFRQHGSNTSVSAFKKLSYYKEHASLMRYIKSRWEIPAATVKKFYEKVSWQYHHFHLERDLGILDKYIDENSLVVEKREKHHILISLLGFYAGGGEMFPIHLANALKEAGQLVSVLTVGNEPAIQEIADLLDPGIPVYQAGWVGKYGSDRFLDDAGISLIHSHMVCVEAFFFELATVHKQIPYIVTLHGSYEACEVSPQLFEQIRSRVSHFVYTADKNLAPLNSFGIDLKRFSKFRNAMPLDPRPFPKSRNELGIPDDAIVFTLVARGVVDKGWEVAIPAYLRLRARHPEVAMHLLLCGEGPETDRQFEHYGREPGITFLGFQSRIHGLYRLSDCAIVPTRFSGESFPLCIIQAFQESVPVIATDVGEIRAMMTSEDGSTAGVVVQNRTDTAQFIANFEAAMETLLSPERRQIFGSVARALGETYDLKKLASDYIELYSKVCDAVSEPSVERSTDETAEAA